MSQHERDNTRTNEEQEEKLILAAWRSMVRTWGMQFLETLQMLSQCHLSSDYQKRVKVCRRRNNVVCRKQ